jgi:hypothetical protein
VHVFNGAPSLGGFSLPAYMYMCSCIQWCFPPAYRTWTMFQFLRDIVLLQCYGGCDTVSPMDREASRSADSPRIGYLNLSCVLPVTFPHFRPWTCLSHATESIKHPHSILDRQQAPCWFPCCSRKETRNSDILCTYSVVAFGLALLL